MKFGKKLLAVVLAGVLALAMLTACGGANVPTPISADQIADAINDARLADSQKSGLTRNLEIEKLYEPVAKAEAEWSADRTDENKQKVQAAYEQARASLAATKINGKSVDMEKTWISVSYDLTSASMENFINALKDENTKWCKRFVKDEKVVGMAVTTATKNGHNGVVMIAIVLKDAE